jgi:hypothetical protein
MVVSTPLPPHLPPLTPSSPQQDGSRTFIVLILATITSFFGKKHWDSKYKAGGANDNNNNNNKKKEKEKGKNGRRRRRRRDDRSGGRRDRYDPDEIDRCVSVFED